jgi:putative PIN family toxin of toxin-antitoxin system
MPEKPRIVVDTNVLLSRLFFRNSVAALAVRQAMSVSQLIVSADTLHELDDVLSRPKFDSYLSPTGRRRFFHLLTRAAIHIERVPDIKACRDPKDDRFLALAVAGRAKLILSGDNDLLALHPFRGIEILSPRQYLDRP